MHVGKHTYMYKIKINLIKIESLGQNLSFREVIAMNLVVFTVGLVAVLTTIQ